jgi:hypothetical protein
LALTWGCETHESAPTKAVAHCKDKDGDVRSHPASEATWSPLAIGADLASGDWVQTAEKAWAVIDFLSGSKVEIEPSSVVIIEEPDAEEDKSDRAGGFVALRSGQVHGVMSGEGSAAPHELVVKTPSGKAVRIASVSGAGELDYRVAATESGDVKLSVSKGQATVKSADGASVKLARGQAQEVKAGRLVGDVIALPNPPEPMGPIAGSKAPVPSGGALDLSWRPARSSQRYRVQVSQDESFRKVIDDQTTDTASFAFRPSKPGRYYWRVSTTDERGNESDFTAPRMVTIVEPIPNQLSGPPDNAQLSFGRGQPAVTFSWHPPDPNGEYEIVVAKSSDLESAVVLREKVHGATLRTRELGTGEYFWGVYQIVGGERKPMSQDPRHIVIKRNASGLLLPKKLKWE